MMARLSTNDLPSIGLLIYGVWSGLVYGKTFGYSNKYMYTAKTLITYGCLIFFLAKLGSEIRLGLT